jgi:glycosyltransferase involved in cell wall biosynthesis
VTSKGCKYLVEAFASLQRNDAVLVLVGDGPERANIEAMVTRYNLTDSVRFVGHIAQELTPKYYGVAYVQVLPSITTEAGKEPWALVVNEAFNQGVPVIASDAVGAAAGGLVQEGVNGFVVPERDSLSLAKAIRVILDDERLRERLSAHASAEIAGWTHRRMANVFVDAIQYAMMRKSTSIEPPYNS